MELLLKLLYPRNTKEVIYKKVLVSNCYCLTNIFMCYLAMADE